MTPERAAALVTRWVRRYTRGLEPPVAERRVTEIEGDLHDHVADARAAGSGERRIALSVISRMARGLPADASWRRSHLPRKERPMHRSAVRVAVVTGLVLLVPLISTVAGDGNWGVFDFVFAAMLLAGAGTIIELAVRRPGRLVYRAGAVALGAVAMVLGELDDAPGLFGFGLLLILGAVALQVRTARSA